MAISPAAAAAGRTSTVTTSRPAGLVGTATDQAAAEPMKVTVAGTEPAADPAGTEATAAGSGQPPSDRVTGLGDRQRVRVDVTGSGLGAGVFLRVGQCPVGSGAEGCSWVSAFLSTDGARVSTTVALRAVVSGTDCRAGGACELVGFLAAGPTAPTEVFRVPLQFDPNLPLAPAPALAASPTEGLVDGQSVRVEGAGFGSDERLSVIQCLAGPISWETCDTSTWAPARTTDSTFSAQTEVRAILSTHAGTVDCRISQCVLVAGFGESEVAAALPVTFLRPPPVGAGGGRGVVLPALMEMPV